MSTWRGRERNRLPVNGDDAARAARDAIERLRPAAVARRLTFPFTAPTVPGGVEPERPPRNIGSTYDTDWARRYPARMTRVLLVEGLLRPTIEVLASPQVGGLDRLARLEGPAIFAANHHSHIDTPLLLATIPEPWRHHMAIGAAADYFFGNQVTATLSALVIGAIPIERTKVTRRSADQAAELIDAGWSFLIFPEGGRSPDGWGQPFRGGAAYLASRCGVPVVPIHVAGTSRILPKGSNKPKPAPTRITFGHPMRPDADEDSRAFAVRLETEVASLGDEARTDWYSARKRAHSRTSPSLQGPSEHGAWRRTWALGERSAKRRRQQRPWPRV